MKKVIQQQQRDWWAEVRVRQRDWLYAGLLRNQAAVDHWFRAFASVRGANAGRSNFRATGRRAATWKLGLTRTEALAARCPASHGHSSSSSTVASISTRALWPQQHGRAWRAR